MANQNGWNTVGIEENKGSNVVGNPQEDKLDFLATPEGDTKIRVMDEAPYFYQGYWSVNGNGAKDGNGNGCFVPYKGKGKDLLEKANQEFMAKVFKEADEKGLKNGSKERKKFLKDNGYDKQPYGKLKSKYIIHVIDRADGQLKLLDAGAGIFEELKSYAMNEEYGDLREYDVTINREGTGWQDTKYKVTPARSNTPRTPEEIKLYEDQKVDREKLKGGEGLTPEQCLFIAEGGLWSELPQEDASTEKPAEGVTVEFSIPDEDGVTTVITSKEGALSDEELADINF
ncbi:phosphoesterase [Bacillus toyonensis]|uniref:phosphoesterase n=1 Tax=Bacillus toyonensis TaxID=155322 RepID=UPI000BF14716|nr:phosphoesterase [Bacillus toyonensis]PEM64458.1 phosphoesterase [Bacillus toyonensis]